MQSNGSEAIGSASSMPVQDDGIYLESRNPAVRGLERIIAEIAPTSIPVLLAGESGSGKRTLAVRIHGFSRQRSGSFLRVNCTGLTAESLEEVLHSSETNGLRGLSGTATVFLGEIGNLDPGCQSGLLRATPDHDTAPPDGLPQVRLISSTRRNLEDDVRCGRFDEELYYRLNGVCLRLPPLRNRKEDIPGLVDFFLTRYAARLARPKPLVSSGTLRSFLEYSWPGNIRQLENTVKQIVTLGDERLAQAELETGVLPSLARSAAGGRLSLKEAARAASRQAERELILKALEQTRWNRKRAARELQISYKALLYKLKQIGLDDSATSFNPRGERE